MRSPFPSLLVQPAGEIQTHDSSGGVRIHSVPLPHRRVREPVLVVDPVRPVGRVVESHEDVAIAQLCRRRRLPGIRGDHCGRGSDHRLVAAGCKERNSQDGGSPRAPAPSSGGGPARVRPGDCGRSPTQGAWAPHLPLQSRLALPPLPRRTGRWRRGDDLDPETRSALDRLARTGHPGDRQPGTVRAVVARIGLVRDGIDAHADVDRPRRAVRAGRDRDPETRVVP